MATLLTWTHLYFAYHISGKVLQGTRATSESNGKTLGEKVNTTSGGVASTGREMRETAIAVFEELKFLELVAQIWNQCWEFDDVGGAGAKVRFGFVESGKRLQGI
jgi:hypothetical protein